MSGPGRKMPDFTKNKDVSLKSLGFLFRFLKPFSPAIIIAIICAFLVGPVAGIFLPINEKFIQQFISKRIKNDNK